MFLAKPFDKNFLQSQMFEDVGKAKRFLDEFTGVKMPLDEWYMLGKILKQENGTFKKIDIDEETFL